MDARGKSPFLLKSGHWIISKHLHLSEGILAYSVEVVIFAQRRV